MSYVSRWSRVISFSSHPLPPRVAFFFVVFLNLVLSKWALLVCIFVAVLYGSVS